MHGSRLNRESLGIPDEKARYLIQRDLVVKKVNTLLLPLMRKHDIDMWIVMDREYNPDPFAAEIGGQGGVRNAHIFFDSGERLEKVFIFSHPPREDLAPRLYDEMIHYAYRPEGLRPHLAEAVQKRNPRRIALNMSPTLPMADGLTVSLKRYLDEAIGPELAAREVSAELLQRDFRATRIPEETDVYRRLVEWTTVWEEVGLSREAITPGVTTPDDVHWWWREQAKAIGLDIASFLPGLRIMRNGDVVEANDPNTPIEPGDCLSIDAGLSFIHFQTDMKRSAYVLRPGEAEPPRGMKKGLAAANAVTDRLIANMVPGRLGHEVWDLTMAALNEDGYETNYAMAGPTDPRLPEVGIYCHSVGTSVHDIGARTSEDNPHAFGDRVRYPLALDNWYSIEHHTSTPIAEWDFNTLRVNTEEDSILTDRGIEFLVPRQTEWLLI
ncbi:MAG TPA: M24 family metallopeptidase [Chloroflexota bacterium]|jgi:Xaa-Pro aminopeptidase